MVRALLLLLTIAAVAVAIAVVAALLLGLGTALSLVFAVSVWEATVVVMVAAWGTIWFFANVLFPTADLPDESDEPAVWVTDLPLRGSRGSRRRRR